MIVISKKLLIVLPVLLIPVALFLSHVSIYHMNNESKYKEMYEELLANQPPDIISIQFDDTVVENSRHDWVELKREVKIRVFLKGPATMVELFITPVGTSTYKETKLIYISYPINGVAEFIWGVPENTMGHFWVVAYNKDIGRKSFFVKVIGQELR